MLHHDYILFENHLGRCCTYLHCFLRLVNGALSTPSFDFTIVSTLPLSCVMQTVSLPFSPSRPSLSACEISSVAAIDGEMNVDQCCASICDDLRYFFSGKRSVVDMGYGCCQSRQETHKTKNLEICKIHVKLHP